MLKVQKIAFASHMVGAETPLDMMDINYPHYVIEHLTAPMLAIVEIKVGELGMDQLVCKQL